MQKHCIERTTMKISYKEQAPAFPPVNVNITLESAADVMCWLTLLTHPERTAQQLSVHSYYEVPVETLQAFIDSLCIQKEFSKLTELVT